ncbi:MAG: hypothetical protein HY578_08465 [Nitrospinae bacterium]|nr:hypothetical protein [Nitrospinota bacterium]
MRAKAYTETHPTCCAVTLDNCKVCKKKDNCFILREQMAFYNRLGISQIDDDIDTGSLSNMRHLWQDSNRTKKLVPLCFKRGYDPSWNYAEDNCRAYTHSIHPYPAMMRPQMDRYI